MTLASETDLRTLYDEHAASLLGFALTFTAGDRGIAEDIVQETLVRAWRHLDHADLEQPTLRSWLLTVARRVAIDVHRARRSRPPEAGDHLLEVPSEVDQMDRRLDRILLLDALAALSEEHRAVLVETYFHGRSVAEASLRLGIPAGTVKSRSYYALHALKLALSERGVRP